VASDRDFTQIKKGPFHPAGISPRNGALKNYPSFFYPGLGKAVGGYLPARELGEISRLFPPRALVFLIGVTNIVFKDLICYNEDVRVEKCHFLPPKITSSIIYWLRPKF